MIGLTYLACRIAISWLSRPNPGFLSARCACFGHPAAAGHKLWHFDEREPVADLVWTKRVESPHGAL